VHQGTTQVADGVLGKVWPGVPAVSDPDRSLYLGFGLARASLGQLLRPRAWRDSVRALLKGHGIGRPRGGDVLQMPGAFLVAGDRITWEHPFEGGAGDLPDWSEVARRARRHDEESVS
jgi:hypothetical protein